MPRPSSSETRVERLVRETPRLIAELRLDRVLQQVADLAAELLNARYAAVGLLSPDNQTLQSFTTSGIEPDQRAHIGTPPVGRGVLGLVIREGRIVRIRDLTTHPAAVGFPPNHPPMHSFLGVPIVGQRGILGDLYATEKIGASEFTDDDEQVAVLLATIIGAAVENALHHEQTARLLEEIQHLLRARERFFAMVNHELRNSLAAVYGWAEMLVRKKDPQSVPRGSFEILEAAEEAVSLINDLLDLSRLDEDRLKPVLQQVDCRVIVRAAVSRVTPSAEAKRIGFVTGNPDGALVCQTDLHRAEQILVNLLTNAVKYSPENTAITITARQVDASIVFSVEDQGPGVPPHDVERIFDIYQTTGERGRLIQGVGIGLPLSRRLARLLGGDLACEPRSPGTGALFVLCLPLGPNLKNAS